MAEPKKKSTASSRGMRRAKNLYTGFKLTKCKKCQSFVKPHYVCPVCGYYNNQKIIEKMAPGKKIKTKITKK
jgi:large subunit ribosomal protein L32